MFLILIFTTILLWVSVTHYRSVSRLPPGPLTLPFFGNIPQALYYSWTLGGIVPMLNAFRKKYGNVFTFWLGPFPHVTITDFETAHEVFVKNGSKYADKPQIPLVEEFRHGYGIVATNGTMWQEVRRFSLQTFRNMGVGKDLMESKIMSELDAGCAFVDSSAMNGETVVDVAEFFNLTVGSVINRILIGKGYNESNKKEFLQLKSLLDDSMTVITLWDTVLPLWFLKSFCGKRFEKIIKAQNDVLEYVSKEAVKRYEDVRDGKISIDKSNPSDYVDSFILKMLEEGSDKNVFNVPSLKAMLVDLWITGQETTTTTLISGFLQLLNHPHVAEKARRELLKVTNNRSRPLSLSDKNEAPYLNALVAEIQRHASILNSNFYRMNHEMTEIGGYPVDAGALVCAQLSALHSNETIFENPKTFDPERFVRNKELAQQLIPFGIGKRACAGEALARAELFLIIGNLLLRYNFEPHGKCPSNIDVAPFSITKKPELYQMKFIKI